MLLVSKPIKKINEIEDYFGRLNFQIPDLVISELTRLKQNAGPKRSRIARTAIEISLSKFTIVKMKTSQHVDDEIIGYALRNRCAVATIDKKLVCRLISNNTIVLTLNKNKLIIANPSIAEQC
jgi:rRNA-processing protein FCF1